MKIVFSVGNFGFLRNFEPALRLLAARGHDLHLVAERKDSVGGTRTLELLEQSYPERITHSYAPSRKESIWLPLAVQLRLSLDYWRYLDRRYDQAPSLRARGASQAPALARALVRPSFMRSGAPLTWLRAVVRTIERALPHGGRVEQFLRSERPDLLLLTPLLYFGSQQVEYVRAAHALGIRTALGVGSWDHLTTKGLIHATPQHVLVWNEAQRGEAFELHGIPPERVTVTGAQAYDHWFVQQPSLTREAFCAKVGVPHDRPLLLYLCSSPFITPHEVPFVRRWIEAIRASADPVLRRAAILIRPHPQNAEQWRDFTAADEAVGIWPRAGANPIDTDARADYFDSMFYSCAVVGVNTSALIESGIVGRPVYTVLTDDFAGQQEGTLHFQHLKNVNGGLLTTAATLAQHVSQLADAVRRQPSRDDKSTAFVRAFVRPYGLEVSAAERFVSAVEQQAAQAAPATVPRRLWQRGITLLMRPVAVAAAAQARARRAAKQPDAPVAPARPARFLFAVSSPEFLRYFDSTMDALVQRGHHVSVAVNWLRERKKARLDELISDPRIEVAGVIPKRSDMWTPLARAVRGTMDFVRYLDPRFAEAPALRARMVRKSLPVLLEPLNRIRSLSPASVDRLQRTLQRVERAIPVGRPLLKFVAAQQPDVVIVSPLVDASSDQVDLVRASQAAGITTVAGIASWDNLTNKGHMRVVPDLVTVWNERQREEATTLHGIPPERVAVTGAQLFDRWFERRPSQSREEFCAMVGLPSDRPIVLYTGSSVFIARSEFEVPFVRRWMATLRHSGDPLLRDAALLVRPHPFNCDAWEHADFGEFGPVAVWPRQRYTPAAEASRSSFFDSLFYSAAVVGINTSAMIEAAILGKPVLSLMTGDFASTQEGTLHFRYLLPENGGFLRVASTLEDHAAQLVEVLRDPEVTRAQTLRFVQHFLRPHGMEKPCTPILVEALERAAAEGPRAAVTDRVADKCLRVVVAPVALSMRASDGLKGFSVEKTVHVVRRRSRKLAYEGYASSKRAVKLAYGRVLKKPSRRALKALRVIFSR